MMPGKVNSRVVAERLAWIEQMAANIRALPLESPEAFLADERNVAAAESYLRRALEALLDLGRHILAKGFGQGVSEYKAVARALAEVGVLNAEEAHLLAVLAGYRNRLVHFYHEVTPEELYAICVQQLDDVLRLAEALRRWAATHPHRLDRTL